MSSATPQKQMLLGAERNDSHREPHVAKVPWPCSVEQSGAGAMPCAESLKAIESITADPFLSQSRVIPKSLARVFVYAKSGESDKVKAELESSLETLKRMANKNPIDPRVQMNMGLVYAMQGDEEQAVMRGQQAMALYPLAKNAINAQRIHIQMGSIYLQLGQVDKCIELLESLKDKPLGMEIGELKTNATWDPVRDHEVFKAIVQ